MGNKQRVAVIGLDGATWDIIKPLADEGRLPAFRKLMNEGAWGILESTELPISSASWTTITTGVNPGKHGIIDFSRRRDNSYKTRPLTSIDVKVPRVWDILGYHDKKVYIINVPMTYPPQEVNGAMISGFPCPEEKNDFSYPPEFIEELRSEIDPDLHFQPRLSPFKEKEFLEETLEITDYVAKATNYIMDRKDFDFLMSVFVAPDALGHVFFRYLDRNHPRYEEREEFVEAYFDVYVKLDKILGTILTKMKDNDKLLLVSDHGFNSVYYAVSLNKWLMERGYLKLKRTLRTRFKKLLFNMNLTPENLFKIAKILGLAKRLQTEAYKESKSLIKKLMDLIIINWSDIDWSQTKAYSQGNFGQIFINLKGREPQGIVTPEEYNQLVNKIISELKEFRYGNERVFDIIKRGDQVYSGKFAKYAPDIICLHSQSKYVVSRFFEFGSKKTITVHPLWSGTHDKRGIFLAWDNGRDIIQGRKVTARVEDITPTILYIFGIPIPRYMDGKVLNEIFNLEFIKTHEIRYSSEDITSKIRIKQRLKKLMRERRL